MDYNLNINGQDLAAQCDLEADGSFAATVGNKIMHVSAGRISDFQMLLTVNGRNITAFIHGPPEARSILINGQSYLIEDAGLKAQHSVGSKSATKTSDVIVPPMPSIVVRILVSEGDKVKKSQPLITVAAMKMETTLTAPYDSKVAKINVAEGDKVGARQVLIDLEKDS
jgi:biotin carboxyl carrier protein